MNRAPTSSLDLHTAHRDAYMSGILLSSDRSRSRISGLDLDFPEDFSNPIKALELRELQEEENWIRNLKVQRDKVISSQIEELRVVIESKDSRIRDLEDELAKFKTVTSQIAKLQTVLDKTETQAKTKEKELSAQVEQYKKQVKEYQGAFEDMRETMRQEQDQLQRETQKYPLFRARSQSYKEQEELNHLRSEYEKYRSYKSHSDELMETVRRESKERESQLQEQISSARVVEKQLKDQLSEMSYEKAEMETRVKELIMIVSEQENQLSGMKDLEGTFHNTNSQVEQLKVENEKLAYEIAVMKESKDTAKVRAEEDLNLLKEDLNVCTQLVKRQEQTISELRKRKLEDDSEIQSLNGKCQKLQREISSIRDASRGEAEDRQQYAQKIETLMGEMERLRAENADLTKQLNAMIEKEAVERRQKEEYARMRLDLINMRNKEMAAFSDALEGIAAKKFEV